MFGKGMKGPKGSIIVVNCGSYQPDKLPPSNDRIEIVAQAMFKRNYACGHRGPRWYKVQVFGVTSIRMRKQEECPECHIAHAKRCVIRCAACGLPIFPGSGVALYSCESKGLDLAIATYVGNSVLGCMRWNCCPSGGFFAGHWSEEGFKPLFGGSTAVESILGA